MARFLHGSFHFAMIMGVGLGLGSWLSTGFIPELYISWSH
jgi:hypothetical protein